MLVLPFGQNRPYFAVLAHFLEGMACYAGHLLAPAEGFGLWPRLLVSFGQNWSSLSSSNKMCLLMFLWLSPGPLKICVSLKLTLSCYVQIGWLEIRLRLTWLELVQIKTKSVSRYPSSVVLFIGYLREKKSENHFTRGILRLWSWTKSLMPTQFQISEESIREAIPKKTRTYTSLRCNTTLI